MALFKENEELGQGHVRLVRHRNGNDYLALYETSSLESRVIGTVRIPRPGVAFEKAQNGSDREWTWEATMNEGHCMFRISFNSALTQIDSTLALRLARKRERLVAPSRPHLRPKKARMTPILLEAW